MAWYSNEMVQATRVHKLQKKQQQFEGADTEREPSMNKK